jgi:hypothetical protein
MFFYARQNMGKNSFTCVNNIQFLLPRLNNALKTFTNEHLTDIPRIISHKDPFNSAMPRIVPYIFQKMRNAPYCSSLSSKRCAMPLMFLTVFQKMRNAPYCSSLSSKRCAMPLMFLTVFQKMRNAPFCF